MSSANRSTAATRNRLCGLDVFWCKGFGAGSGAHRFAGERPPLGEPSNGLQVNSS